MTNIFKAISTLSLLLLLFSCAETEVPIKQYDEKQTGQFKLIPGTNIEMQLNEVTQHEWLNIMRKFPSEDKNTQAKLGDTYPITSVSFTDSQIYARKLSEFDKDYSYRLPTKEEWLLCAKAGQQTQSYETQSWFAKNSAGELQKTATKKANAFGYFDMTGNVMEWTTEAEGKTRAAMGGSYQHSKEQCTPEYSEYILEDRAFKNLGFRLIREKK